MVPGGEPNALSYEVIANALFESYESIYDVNLETGAYNVYHESDSYRGLDLARSGEDFFQALETEVERIIDPEDRDFVLRSLSRESLADNLSENEHRAIIYRILRGDERVYHQLSATRRRLGEADHALMGVRNVDTMMKQNEAHEKELTAERQKSENYLGAILATAVAYTDANLTTDQVLEQSTDASGRSGSHLVNVPSPEEMPCYSEFQTWVVNNIISENQDKYLQISSREHLLDIFSRGMARASVSFSVIRAVDERSVPCRAVFYLYREQASGDVRAFCVIYDLTSEQRREKELEDLKAALDMSRIRNSISQMKPHFLYNALGSIQEIILEDPGRAAALLEDFTVHLRSCVKAMDSDERVPFVRELENIRTYANIEKMRLGDRLTMRYELEATDFDVLPLSIQPLVENAIRHGVHPRGAQGGTVTLRSWPESDAWIVQVQDDGVGFDTRAYEKSAGLSDTESTGLRNMRFRLEKILGAEMLVESEVGTGTTVTVRIPRKKR